MPGVHCVEPRAKYADTVCLAAKPRAQARRAQLTSAAPLSAVAVLNYELPKYTRATETQRTGASACSLPAPKRRREAGYLPVCVRASAEILVEP